MEYLYFGTVTSIAIGKRSLFFLPVLFGCQLSFSQTIEREVIGTGGDFFSTAQGQLEWTLGEVVTEYEDIGQVSLSQGFHQADIPPTGIFKRDAISVGIRVYPNPVQERLYLDRTESSVAYDLIMLDAGGKKCLTDIWPADLEHYELQLDRMADGLYVLLIHDAVNQKNFQYRIAKTITE